MNPNVRLLAAAALASVLAGCGATPSEISPPWLLGLIEREMSQPVANPPAKIVLQECETGVYYYVPPRCCDIWSELYDEEGDLICHPDGGITGSGDGRCPELGTLLREEEVWSDPRVTVSSRAERLSRSHPDT